MWCGVLRCGVVWCSMIWCGVVQCGVVCCSFSGMELYTPFFIHKFQNR